MSARKRPEANPQRAAAPAPRLYLITSLLVETDAFADVLEQRLQAADVAAVLLRLAPADERTLIKRAKALAPAVQGRGAALLLENGADLVARAGADGTHLTGIAAFEAAVSALKPKWIAGCGGLHSRHDAMIAAERGADYVMFGEPGSGDERPSFASVEERVAWWAEVFETPCVGYAASLSEACSLAAAGADFIAVGEWVWSAPDTLGALTRRLAGALT